MTSFMHQMDLGFAILDMPYSKFLIYATLTKGWPVEDRVAILEQLLAEVEEDGSC